MFREAGHAIGISSIGLVAMAHPAFAGVVGVPAPIVGAGLPLLLVAAGAYYAVKLIRARRRD
jgi:hypothetical protein